MLVSRECSRCGFTFEKEKTSNRRNCYDCSKKREKKQLHTCPVCGKSFQKHAYRMVTGYGACSRKCYFTARRRREYRQRTYVECKSCGVEFRQYPSRPVEYCSRNCSPAAFANSRHSIKELSMAPQLEPEGFVSTSDLMFYVTSGSRTRVPDWVNRETKQIVEFFGTYWHRHDRGREDEIIQWYRDAGWECEIVWEDELEDWRIRRKKE